MSKYSREFLIEFFEMYKNYTCLWKVKCSEYHNRISRKRAMLALVAKFKEVEPDATEDLVKKKINNFRTSYKRERNFVDSSLKSGAGTDEVYTPKLWYYDLLTFLDEQVMPRRSTSNIVDCEEELDETQEVNEIQGVSGTEDLSHSMSEDRDMSITADDDYSNQESQAMTVSSASMNDRSSVKIRTPLASPSEGSQYENKRIKRNNDASEVLLNTINKRFKEKATREKDRFDISGENVAVKLRFLRNDQRLIAEKLINDVLYEAEWNNLDKNWKVMKVFDSPQGSLQPPVNTMNTNDIEGVPINDNRNLTPFANAGQLFRLYNPENLG